ncbi:MAG TPA: nuclear transport factor 2 family protein [Flavisolibacter sp.]|jgi:ketosteroid isomerase-like protein|nr:nuclear transport factor 2 family protein [Flavisolibacter sp.]
MKKLFILFALSVSLSSMAQTGVTEKAIRALLLEQTHSWNRGDIEGFMQTYWKSDSLMFIGKNGVVRGWQQTLDNYKKSYPDTAAMGQLSFDIIKVEPLAPDRQFVVGKWMLQRAAGNLSGHFTLILKKFRGSWKIVADHSS